MLTALEPIPKPFFCVFWYMVYLFPLFQEYGFLPIYLALYSDRNYFILCARTLSCRRTGTGSPAAGNTTSEENQCMQMKKTLAAILSTSMTLSMLSVSAFAAEDKPLMEDAANSWAASSIDRWVQQGIVRVMRTVPLSPTVRSSAASWQRFSCACSA